MTHLTFLTTFGIITNERAILKAIVSILNRPIMPIACSGYLFECIDGYQSIDGNQSIIGNQSMNGDKSIDGN